jgi:hypothetical protein
MVELNLEPTAAPPVGLCAAETSGDGIQVRDREAGRRRDTTWQNVERGSESCSRTESLTLHTVEDAVREGPLGVHRRRGAPTGLPDCR